MPAERLPMRKIREVLRLKYACGVSDRVIARSVGIGRTAIAEYVRRAAVIGISWPIPEELDDTALERKLFAPAGYNPPRSKPLPDWGHVHAELRRRGVTLALLWEEYRGHHPEGYGYSRFCDLLRGFERRVEKNLPIGHIFYNIKEPDYPAFNVAFWVRGNTYNMEPHLFYQGKEIGVIFNDGIQMGKAICRAIVENEPTHTPHNMVGGAKWSRMDCEFPIVKGWDNKGENQKDIFKMAENPGEYEFKLLWNNKLARSIKFTVGPNGKLDNGIAAANKLGTGRVIVPVMIIGDQDGLWDKNAWKTDAFYGNPLSGFTPPQ